MTELDTKHIIRLTYSDDVQPTIGPFDTPEEAYDYGKETFDEDAYWEVHPLYYKEGDIPQELRWRPYEY